MKLTDDAKRQIIDNTIKKAETSPARNALRVAEGKLARDLREHILGGPKKAHDAEDRASNLLLESKKLRVMNILDPHKPTDTINRSSKITVRTKGVSADLEFYKKCGKEVENLLVPACSFYRVDARYYNRIVEFKKQKEAAESQQNQSVRVLENQLELYSSIPELLRSMHELSQSLVKILKSVSAGTDTETPGKRVLTEETGGV